MVFEMQSDVRIYKYMHKEYLHHMQHQYKQAMI